MKRNLKALGVALMAMLTVGAVMASAASAVFDSEIQKTTIEGEQLAPSEHQFKIDAGTTTCNFAKFHSIETGQTTKTGPITGAASGGAFTVNQITTDAIYQNCTSTLIGAVTVDMSSCDYLLTANGASTSATTRHGSVHIQCHAAGDRITVTGGICNVTIFPQTLNGILYHNEGAGKTRDLKVAVNVANIAYTQGGIFCPGGQGAKNNGTYKGNVTLKGTSTAGVQPGIWVT